MSGAVKPRRVVNGWVIPSDAVRAVDRFNPDGPTGYRAVEPWAVDAPIRATRDDARRDIEVGL